MARKSSRPDFVIQGVKEIRERAASALATSVTDVTVDRHRYSGSGLMLRCAGSARGKRFFAKIFLADPYPVPDRFRAPWEDPFASNDRSRSVESQIAAEWEMTLRMRALLGCASIPAPLGKSLADRTIVWEEARGTVMHKLLRRCLTPIAKASTGTAALTHAGRWLRRLHETSAQGTQTIDISDALDRLEKECGAGDLAFRKYIAMAMETLRASVRAAGKSTFTSLVALTHGDYSLPNLIWDPLRSRLAVVDFELSWSRSALHDLSSLISDLRVHLLNPMIPKGVIAAWEDAFWNGYGPVSPELPLFVNSFALSRIFYHQLPKLLTRRKRRGRLAGANAAIYRTLFEDYVITKRLGVTPRPAFPNSGDRGVATRHSLETIANADLQEGRDADNGL